MASEQLPRSHLGVYNETLLEIREVNIQKHRKDQHDKERNEQERELNADKARSQDKEDEEAKSVGVDKFEMKGQSEEEAATKGLRDREENERREKMEAEHARTMEHTKEAQAKQKENDEGSLSEDISKYRCQKAMDDATANAKERAKQEPTNKADGTAYTAQEECTARNKQDSRVGQNEESKERPSEKSTTKSFEETQEQDQEERSKEPGAVSQTLSKVSLPHKPNQSDTVESFQGVQQRDKETKHDVFEETKIQHAEKMNKTEENLNSQEERGKGSNVFNTYADTVKVNDSTRRVQEQEPNGNTSEKSFEVVKEEQPRVNVVQMLKEPLDKAAEGGSNVLGAVGETVTEIGENVIKPAEKVSRKGEEEKGGGVLGAIGETVAEIAETTKVFAVGEGETESKQSIGSKVKK